MFCSGTSEGFLTLWTSGGGRCIRSELVLPFAPTQMLFFQRYNPLAHTKSSQRSPSPSPPAPTTSPSAPPARRALAATMHNYILCCSDDSPDVYVVELPSLTLLCVLQHRAVVLGMSLAPPAFSKQRTPFLVTVTAQHHVCMWDLSMIEKKRDEKRRARVRQQHHRGPYRPASLLLSAPPATSDALPPLPSSFLHPVSSLASNSASIVTPGSSPSPLLPSSSSPSPSTDLVLRWDDPSHSFLIPLPPLSFTLAALFVPVALCLSPCGTRGIVVFPYAFLMIDLHTGESEGRLHTMAAYLSERETPPTTRPRSHTADAWTREDTLCMEQHAPWSGAGFITAPPFAQNASSAGSPPPPPPQRTVTASAAETQAGGVQHLVLWNVTGEFIWVFSLSPDLAVTSPASPLRSPGGAASPSSGLKLKRSLSTSKLSISERPVHSLTRAANAYEAPEMTHTTNGQTGATQGRPPRVRLVAKCIMRELPPPPAAHSPSSPAPVRPTPQPNTPIAVHLSGHTIFAGTEDGALFQWHVPICAPPGTAAALSDGAADSSPRILTPTHVSRVGDAFTHATTAATTDVASSPSPSASPPIETHQSELPRLNRALSTPDVAPHTDLLRQPQPLSPTAAVDPPTVSSYVVDSLHEAVLLVVGHTSGALRVHNVLSKGSAHLAVAARHRAAVTAIIGLKGWTDTCMIATGGVDGRVLVLEASTGKLHLMLSCSAPIISLHKPSASHEEACGVGYKDANASLLFVDCADSTVRCFSLVDGRCVFVGRGLDAPARAVYRPAWAIVADVVLVLTRIGTVFIFSLTSSHLMQVIDVTAGASAFLQKHDLLVPGSQLAILAHRLYQMKNLRRKTAILPPIHSANDVTSETNSTAASKERDPTPPSFTADEPMSDVIVRLTLDDMPLDPLAPTAPAAGVTSYETAPPPLQRTVSSGSRLAPAATAASDAALDVPPSRHFNRRRSGSQLIDAHFQREIYWLNQQHQQMERDEREGKRQTLSPAVAAAAAAAATATPRTTAPTPGLAAPRPIHYSPSVSTITNEKVFVPPSHANSLAPPNQGGPLKPSASASSLVGGVAPSPSPPPHGFGRSPIACIDVVSSSGSSASPLAHLHASVYVWNVHQILAHLTAHAGTLAAMAKRAAAQTAARADPTNAQLAAAANAASSKEAPPSFYVVCGLLSTLFDWDSHSAIDSAARGALRCYRPSPPTAFASLSDNSQSLTLLLPSQSHDHNRWSFDPDLTARHALAITAVLSQLLDKIEVPASPVASCIAAATHYYHVTVPRSLRLYVESDLHALALFSLNLNRTIHLAARQLFQQSLARMPADHRLQVAEFCGRFFEYALPAQRRIFQPEFALNVSDLVASGSIMAVCENGPGIGYVSDEEMVHAMMLTRIGLFEVRQQQRRSAAAAAAAVRNESSHAPSTTSSPPPPATEGITEFQAKSQFLTNTLLRMIAWPVSTDLEIVKCTLACDLLADGLHMFRHHITEAPLLLPRLYALSRHAHEPLAKAASHALLDCGKTTPTNFITCIGGEATNYRASTASRQGALMCVVNLIKKHPLALARSLATTVRMIVGTLNPAEPTLRKALMQTSTLALYSLVTVYPQVSLNQPTQRYAVGTAEGAQSAVIVYDLRTATKWRILEGHKGDIHAVSFHPKGLSLASYSATENPPSVRVWSTGGGGFLSGLLGMEGKCIHSWPMLPCKTNYSAATTAAMQTPTKSAKQPSNPLVTPPRDDGFSSPAIALADSSPAAPTILPSRSPPPRSLADALLSVKIMWVSDKSLKLKREDGQVVEFNMG